MATSELDRLRYPKQRCRYCLLKVGCQFISALRAAQELDPESVQSVLQNRLFPQRCANYAAILSVINQATVKPS